jgi:cytochrome b6-f complex iron-sulfur subunit
MKTQRLPVAAECGGCSRRELLQGLGVTAVGALALGAIGCGQSGSSLPTATTASCGAGQCIDLTDANNKDLAAAGGAMLVDMASDTIMVIRVSDTQVVAVSAICTHAGCSMDYLADQDQIDCPCHGSRFSTTGQVLRGPAIRALRVYNVTLANNMITVS